MGFGQLLDNLRKVVGNPRELPKTSLLECYVLWKFYDKKKIIWSHGDPNSPREIWFLRAAM